MTNYTVTINIDHEVESHWFDWMRNQHIPDVLATKLFSECIILKAIEPEEEGKSTYSFLYMCESDEELNLYLAEHATRLRDEHTALFKGRFTASRSISEVLDVKRH
mgnify:CR=1 FL=1